MNQCRTCKHWGKKAHMIGAGVCCNVMISQSMFLNNQIVLTAQDFGCVLHEEGESQLMLESSADAQQILSDFLGDRITHPK